MRLKVGKSYLDFVISQEAIFHAQFRHRDRRTCAKASFKALTASGLLGLLRSIASALALKTNPRQMPRMIRTSIPYLELRMKERCLYLVYHASR